MIRVASWNQGILRHLSHRGGQHNIESPRLQKFILCVYLISFDSFLLFLQIILSWHETSLPQVGFCSVTRITRRRKHQADPFAAPDWVRSIFDQLKAPFTLLFSLEKKDKVRLARAVRSVERYSATDTRHGRPARRRREDLVRVGLTLTDLRRR